MGLSIKGRDVAERQRGGREIINDYLLSATVKQRRT
jgi:hypothetical protein